MMLGAVKRLLLGQPMRSDRLGHTLLPKRIALPVFASDALSSVAYATEEILIVLSVGGIAFFHYTPYIALAVGVLMLVVVASYRQNVHAYPSGGGDYEVTSTNLGPKIGIAVASALMVDYTLTVAVSVSAGVANLASAFPVLDSHVTLIAVLVVAVIALMNLRGVRESGTAFAIPTYCFIGVVALLIIVGFTRLGLGHHLESDSARLPDQGEPGVHRGGPDLPAAARVLLRLHRAHRGGGDQQRGTGVPQAEEQERRDHAGPAGRDRGDHVRRGYRAGAGQSRALRARPEPDRDACRDHPAHRDRTGRPGRVRGRLAAVLCAPVRSPR